MSHPGKGTLHLPESIAHKRIARQRCPGTLKKESGVYHKEINKQKDPRQPEHITGVEPRTSDGQEINGQDDGNDNIQVKEGLLGQLSCPGAKAEDQKIPDFT